MAKQYCEVNMGQGFPNYIVSDYIPKIYSQVVMEGNDYLQYTPERGHPR